MAQRTVCRRVHTGGLVTEVNEHTTQDGTIYLVVIGWNPAMPSAPFDRMVTAQGAADDIVAREVHDCTARQCPPWEYVRR